MRHLLLTPFFYAIIFLTRAQSGKNIIAEIASINQSVTAIPCNTDSAAAISHRAMNIFLADKTGYLAASSDLSFYTNYTTFNTAEGKLTINHNFQQATKNNDEPIKKLFSAGLAVTIGGNYAMSFLDKRFENELGATLNYKWLGKVKTRFADCTPSQNNSNQKKAMDALRAVITKELELEITKKEADFELALQAIDTAAAKTIVQQDFYTDLQLAAEEKFATQQAALLTKTRNFKLVTTSWTSITAYIPVFFPGYTVSPSLTSSFTNKHPYPFSVMLGHTWLRESAKLGRLFFTLDGALLFNNAKLSYGLSKLNFAEYKSLGGTDTLHSADPGNNKLYIGRYASFITPSLTARIVYFPCNSHVGLSFLAEKNWGDYDLLHFKLGIPIVLINSKKTPAVNIECYVLFLDIANIMAIDNKRVVGLSIGIPFSRLMY